MEKIQYSFKKKNRRYNARNIYQWFMREKREHKTEIQAGEPVYFTAMY